MQCLAKAARGQFKVGVQALHRPHRRLPQRAPLRRIRVTRLDLGSQARHHAAGKGGKGEVLLGRAGAAVGALQLDRGQRLLHAQAQQGQAHFLHAQPVDPGVQGKSHQSRRLPRTQGRSAGRTHKQVHAHRAHLASTVRRCI